MIFISHKKEDEEKALKLEKFLKEKDIDCYVDVLDSTITATNVTERIVKNLRDANHLIVIFSEHTVKSMWVPFELGVSFERNNGIGVLLWPDNENTTLITPEYLDEFPIMKDANGVNKYIELYKQQTVLMEKYGFQKTASPKNYASTFIKSLKSKL